MTSLRELGILSVDEDSRLEPEKFLFEICGKTFLLLDMHQHSVGRVSFPVYITVLFSKRAFLRK